MPISSSEAIDAAALGDLDVAVGDEHVRALVDLMLLQLLAAGRRMLVSRFRSMGCATGKLRGRRAPAAGDETAGVCFRGRARAGFDVYSTQTSATGVVWVASWPCGQDSRPKPGCHRRRDLCHEARGGGYWFCLRGRCRIFYGRYATGPVTASRSD
jgi:hypothetical protein